MKKISELPLAENVTDAIIPIVQDGVTKKIAADKIGGGEWEDVTSCFQLDETALTMITNSVYFTSRPNYNQPPNYDLNGKFVRITVQGFNAFSANPMGGDFTGEVVVYVKPTDNVVALKSYLGIITYNYDETYEDASTLFIDDFSIQYYFGQDFDITNAYNYPIVTKIEVLKEN